jgi:hypothetical protein
VQLRGHGIYDTSLIHQFVRTLEDTILVLLFVIKYVQFIFSNSNFVVVKNSSTIKPSIGSCATICNTIVLELAQCFV